MSDFVWRFKLEKTEQTQICPDVRTEFVRRTLAQVLDLVELYDQDGKKLIPQMFSLLSHDDTMYPIYDGEQRNDVI